MTEITRSELYELIWSQPMTEIARFYGVPAMKVAQACDVYEIARPPAGYWQKLAYGKAPERFALANTNYASDKIVTIEDRKNGSLAPAGECGVD
jgi:hypothetical protein